jgi:hypothetical protein
VDISGPLRQALAKLENEKTRIDRQIAALRQVLGAMGARRNASSAAPPRRGRKRMSAKERKIVSARMKAYWAKRRDGGAKGQRNPK